VRDKRVRDSFLRLRPRRIAEPGAPSCAALAPDPIGTLLLVIDVQESFKVDSARWAARSNPRFEANVAGLVAAFREAGQPLVFVLHTDADAGFRASDRELRLMAFLERRDSEPLVLKDTRNAFTSTDLEVRLDALGERRIVVCGLTTEQCCETTTRVAADLGYDVVFVTEATATFPLAGLSTEALVERTEAVLRGRFARIATVAEVGRDLQSLRSG